MTERREDNWSIVVATLKTTFAHIITTFLIAFIAIGNPTVLFAADTVENQTGQPFTFPEMSASSNAPLRGKKANGEDQIRQTPVGSSGSYSTGISIDVPPGRLGMTPAMALSYDSSSFRQDSPVGTGWSFNLPQIRRFTGDGTPSVARASDGSSYYSTPGVFESTATGKLVPVSSAQAPTGADGDIYAAEIDSSRNRYEFLSKQASGIKGGMWIEHLPDGRKRYYGGDPTGRRAQVVNELGTYSYLLMMEEDVWECNIFCVLGQFKFKSLKIDVPIL